MSKRTAITRYDDNARLILLKFSHFIQALISNSTSPSPRQIKIPHPGEVSLNHSFNLKSIKLDGHWQEETIHFFMISPHKTVGLLTGIVSNPSIETHICESNVLLVSGRFFKISITYRMNIVILIRCLFGNAMTYIALLTDAIAAPHKIPLQCYV
jgi:hypothetical protein